MNFIGTHQSRIVIIFLILIIFWSAFGLFLAPRVIEQAYNQQSHPFINQIISGFDIHGIKLYLDKWQKIYLLGLFCLLAYPAMLLGMMHRRFWRDCVGTSSPHYLALLRIFACAALIIIILMENLPSAASVPASLIRPMGIMSIFYTLPIGFDLFLTSPVALGIFQVLTIVFLVLGLIGYRHKLFLPLSALFYLVLGGIIRQYSHLIHPGLVPFYVLCVLSFAPCSDVWSLDAYSKRIKVSSKATTYGFFRYMCWIVIALPYVFSGLSKIRNGGYFWWQGLNLKAILLRDSLQPMQFNFDGGFLMKDFPEAVFSFMGAFTIFGEVLFVLILFFSWARILFPVAMVLMHAGILLTQNVLFLDLIVFLWVFPIGERLEKTKGEYKLSEENRPSGKNAIILCSIAALLIFSWTFRVEYYPLTSWQMYSYTKDKEITYYKIVARHESGVTKEFKPYTVIEILRYGRIKDRIGYCFTPDNPFICRDFYLQCGRLYNNREENKDKIEAIEIQKWKWDILNNLADPSYGYLKDNKIISIR